MVDNQEISQINTRRFRNFRVLPRIFAGTLFSLLFFAASVFGQGVHTPEKGSAERKEILDALRVPVEKELKQKIIFVIETFNVQGNWAFVSGAPNAENGGRPDYTGTEYQDAIDSDAFDNNFFALLRKTGGKWKLVTKAIGCTDVCFLTWWKDHKAPKAIFPYTE